MLLRGTLELGQGHPFHATAFTDRERHDAQGRAVAHYLVWLGEGASSVELDPSFGVGLVDAFEPGLDAIFELDPKSLALGAAEALDVELQRRFRAALGV